MKNEVTAWTPWFWVGITYSLRHPTYCFFTLANYRHLLKWGSIA